MIDLTEKMRRAANGDRQAFLQVYDATASDAYLLALCHVHDGAAAEQVVKEAYVDLWRRSARYDPSSMSVPAWVLAVVQRTARPPASPHGPEESTHAQPTGRATVLRAKRALATLLLKAPRNHEGSSHVTGTHPQHRRR